MKKLFALILTILLTISLLAGCAGTTVVIGNCDCPCKDQTPTNPSNPTNPTDPSKPAEGALKLGMSVSTTISDSVSAAENAPGEIKYDVTIAAVLVDDNGVIVSCVIDSIPATVKFDTTGKITTDLTADVLTKNELGDDYNMVAWGGAKAEWYAQVAAFARYAEGKTVEQLKNGDIDMTTGKAKDDTDLASSASIYLAGYVYAVEAAVSNAEHRGAQAGDVLVLSTLNSLKSSVSATADAKGTAQLDADMVALTKNGDKITSCYIDSLQAKVSFDATGKITTDLTADVLTKNELGDAYNMVAWGGAMAEWNVQAAAFADYVTGKTAEEVAGIAVSESTKPADGTDLSASVTIAIGGLQALIAKAMK